MTTSVPANASTTPATIRMRGQFVYFEGGELDGRHVHVSHLAVQDVTDGQQVIVRFSPCSGPGGTWVLYAAEPA